MKARRKNAARLLLVGAFASVAFAAGPAPAAPDIYCPPDDPVCIPFIVACRSLNTLHNKVKYVPECNLA